MTNWSQTRTPLSVGVNYPMSVWDDDYVYIFYGRTGISSFPKTVLKYDIANDSYEALANMSYSRYNAAAAFDTVNNNVWIVGGRSNTGSITSSVYIYNLDNETTVTITSIPVVSVALGAIYYNGKIYVFGGFNGSANVDNVYSWEIGVSSSWANETDIPTAKRGFGYCLVGSLLYVVGNVADDNTCYVTDLDDTTLSWTALDDLAADATSFAGSCWHYNDGTKDWIYFINIYQEVYRLDVTGGATTNNWEDMDDDYSTRQAGAAIGQNGNELIIFGGLDLDDTYEEDVISYTIPITSSTIRVLKRII